MAAAQGRLSDDAGGMDDANEGDRDGGRSAPLPFRSAVDGLRAARLRPQIEIEPTPAPKRLAPFAHAPWRLSATPTVLDRPAPGPTDDDRTGFAPRTVRPATTRVVAGSKITRCSDPIREKSPFSQASLVGSVFPRGGLVRRPLVACPAPGGARTRPPSSGCKDWRAVPAWT